MKMTELQMRLIKENLKVLTSKDCFYKEKFKDIDVEAIQTQEDFEKTEDELKVEESMRKEISETLDRFASLPRKQVSSGETDRFLADITREYHRSTGS